MSALFIRSRGSAVFQMMATASSHSVRALCLLALGAVFSLACGPLAAQSGSEGVATFTVDARLGGDPARGLQVSLLCTPGQTVVDSAWVADEDTHVFSVAVGEGEERVCTVQAEAPPGLLIRYRGDGGSLAEIADDGCRFSTVRAGHSNFCQIRVQGRATSLTVYKKWIGTTRSEPDVAIRLLCDGAYAPEDRQVNAGRPGAWSLDLTDPNGTTCSVEESGREDFVADDSDCRALLILPGSQEECTMVNTKVVKMIDMLNRYGLFIMIAVFLVAGMIASRRMAQ